jgi:hypothetical protein
MITSLSRKEEINMGSRCNNCRVQGETESREEKGKHKLK